MRCSKARRLISEYLDGELDSRRERSLRAHCAACADCRELLADFSAVVKEAGHLSAPAPSDAVWSKIRARLDAEKRDVRLAAASRRPGRGFFAFQPAVRYALTVAVVLAVVAGGIFLGTRHWGRSDPLAKLKEAEHHYQLAIKALDEALASQKNGVDPELARVLSRNLQVINATIAACEQAVRQDPNDLGARTYLLAAYGEKVNFLNDLMEMRKKPSLSKESKTSL